MNFDAEPAPGDMAGKAVGTLSNLEMVGERWIRYDPNTGDRMIQWNTMVPFAYRLQS